MAIEASPSRPNTRQPTNRPPGTKPRAGAGPEHSRDDAREHEAFRDRPIDPMRRAPGQLERTSGAAVEGAAPHKRELPSFGDFSPSPNVPPIDRSRYETSSRLDGTLPFQPHRESSAMANDAIRTAATPPTVDDLRAGSKPKFASPFGKTTGPANSLRTSSSMRAPRSSNAATSRRLAQNKDYIAAASSPVVRGSLHPRHEPTRRPERCSSRTQAASAAVRRGYSESAQYSVGSKTESCAPEVSNVGAPGTARSRPRDIEAFGVSGCGIRGDPGSPFEGTLGAAHSGVMGRRGPMDAVDVRSYHESAPGRRDITTGSARLYGHMQPTNPPRAEVYDPSATMRTTMKETTVHDTSSGWLGGEGVGDATSARSPLANARTTGRQTLAEPEVTRGSVSNAATVTKPPVYDPNDILPTTSRDTFANDARSGNIGTLEDASRTNIDAPDTTQRQLWSREHFGNAARPEGDAYKIAASGTEDLGSTSRHQIGGDRRLGSAAPAVSSAPAVDALHRVVGDVKEKALRRRAPAGKRATVSQTDIGSTRPPPVRPVNSNQGLRGTQHVSQEYMSPEQSLDDTRGVMSTHASGVPQPYVTAQLDSNPYAIRARM